MSKQFLFFSLFILAVEYYSFVAMRSVLRNTSSGFQLGMYILYGVLSLPFYGVFMPCLIGFGLHGLRSQ